MHWELFTDDILLQAAGVNVFRLHGNGVAILVTNLKTGLMHVDQLYQKSIINDTVAKGVESQMKIEKLLADQAAVDKLVVQLADKYTGEATFSFRACPSCYLIFNYVHGWLYKDEDVYGPMVNSIEDGLSACSTLAKNGMDPREAALFFKRILESGTPNKTPDFVKQSLSRFDQNPMAGLMSPRRDGGGPIIMVELVLSEEEPPADETDDEANPDGYNEGPPNGNPNLDGDDPSGE